MFAKERLYLTADGQALVAEGDPRGASLYAAPGDEIPQSAAEKFGLVDGDLPVDEALAEAMAVSSGGGAGEAQKDGVPAVTKEGAAGEDKAAPAPAPAKPAKAAEKAGA